MEQHDYELAIPFELPFFIDEKYMLMHKLDYLQVVDYNNTKVNEVTDYELYGVTLNKIDMAVLVYLLYKHYEYTNIDDKDELSIIKYYYKWFTDDEYFKLKHIVTKLLSPKQGE